MLVNPGDPVCQKFVRITKLSRASQLNPIEIFLASLSWLYFLGLVSNFFFFCPFFENRRSANFSSGKNREDETFTEDNRRQNLRGVGGTTPKLSRASQLNHIEIFLPFQGWFYFPWLVTSFFSPVHFWKTVKPPTIGTLRCRKRVIIYFQLNVITSCMKN